MNRLSSPFKGSFTLVLGWLQAILFYFRIFFCSFLPLLIQSPQMLGAQPLVYNTKQLDVCPSVHLSVRLKLKILVTTQPIGFYSSGYIPIGSLEVLSYFLVGWDTPNPPKNKKSSNPFFLLGISLQQSLFFKTNLYKASDYSRAFFLTNLYQASACSRVNFKTNSIQEG